MKILESLDQKMKKGELLDGDRSVNCAANFQQFDNKWRRTQVV